MSKLFSSGDKGAKDAKEFSTEVSDNFGLCDAFDAFDDLDLM